MLKFLIGLAIGVSVALVGAHFVNRSLDPVNTSSNDYGVSTLDVTQGSGLGLNTYNPQQTVSSTYLQNASSTVQVTAPAKLLQGN